MAWEPLSVAAKLLDIEPDTLKKRGQRGLHRRRKEGSRYKYEVPGRDGDGDFGEETHEISAEDVSALRRLGLLDLAAEPDHTATAEGDPADTEEDAGGVILGVFASDIHVPDHDRPAIRALFDFVEDVEPEVFILGGDLVDLLSCSAHDGPVRPPLVVEELAAANRFLDDLDSVLPEMCDRHLLEGNHETRIRRAVAKRFPQMAGALKLEEQLHLEARRFRWHPEGEMVTYGRLGFIHGRLASINHSRANVLKHLRSVMYGHTHKPGTTVIGTPYGPLMGMGVGCLQELQPPWMNGSPTQWVHGFGIFEVDLGSGDFTATQAIIHDGRLVYGGKVYGR